jgi:hypothetical protein
MKPTEELFELIKSLNKSEKRYFKLYFSSRENVNYITLFNEIESREAYDEKAIKEKFKDEKFTKQLTFTKNYLYNSIINSLISYNRSKSTETQLTGLVIKLRILFKKGLYRQYFKAIKKYKAKAWEYEKFYILLEITRLQRLISETKKFRTFDPGKLYEEESEILKKIENTGKYSSLFCQASQLKREVGISGDKTKISRADYILSDDLLKDRQNALSTQALEYYYNIKRTLYSLKGYSGKEFYYSRKRLECIEKNPKSFRDDIIDNRKEALYSLIMLSIERGSIHEFDIYLDKYKSIPAVTEDDKIDREVTPPYVMLQFIISSKQLEEGEKAAAGVKKNLHAYKGKLDRDIELESMFALVKYRFDRTEFDGALYELNELLSHPLIEYRKDIHTYAKLMNVLIHYELGNFELLEYLIESTKRHLSREKEQYRSEIAGINLIKKAIMVRPGRHRIDLTGEMERVIKKIKTPENKKIRFHYFDLADWLEEKLKIMKKSA